MDETLMVYNPFILFYFLITDAMVYSFRNLPGVIDGLKNLIELDDINVTAFICKSFWVN